MERILIPMRAKYKIEESIPAMGIACNIGNIFYYDPDNQVHLELYEGGFFEPVANDECNFFCDCEFLNLEGNIYRYKDEINISHLSEKQLDDLLVIGYIKKVLKETKNKLEKNQTKSLLKIKAIKKQPLKRTL